MYGRAADGLDDFELAQLAVAYARRKRFEAQLIAVEVAKIFAGISDTPTATAPTPAGRMITQSGQVVTHVSARALLDEMGVKLDF